jgi:threonine aldolase
MKTIDLRSDTVTLPTDEMRAAIHTAALGDDVFGDDPTTNKFEEKAAEIMGKQSALLVPSGTMANIVSTLTHCARGEEIILGDKSHIFLNEAGGVSALGSIHPHIVINQPDGTIKLEHLEQAVRGDDEHWPRTRLICLESTHNRCYGAPLAVDYMKAVKKFATERGLAVHLDGARIFNAAVALNTDVKEFTKQADSVAFCLSKGLSAPIGSVICGTKGFIKEARRIRKLLGGGMRQTGVIAAAGIVALDKMTERLKEDHDNARQLAQGIAQISGLAIQTERIKTNIIYFDLVSNEIAPDELITCLSKQGLLFLRTGPVRFRMVTHYGIRSEHIDHALKLLKKVFA